jgi:putative DNA primase/helicase
MLLRLAMVFALTDQTTTIASQHIKAAHSWVQYWTDSVKFIFQSADDEAKTALTSDVANKIKIYLSDNGPTTRTDLSQKCLAGHVSKSIIDTALDELLTTAPPTIEVVAVPRSKGQAGSSTKLYKLFKEAISANCAKSAKFQINHKTEVTTDRGPVNQADISLSSHTSQPYAEKSIS